MEYIDKKPGSEIPGSQIVDPCFSKPSTIQIGCDSYFMLNFVSDFLLVIIGVPDAYENTRKSCVIYKHRGTYKMVYSKRMRTSLSRGIAHYSCRRQPEEPKDPFQCQKWIRQVRGCRRNVLFYFFSFTVIFNRNFEIRTENLTFFKKKNEKAIL